MESKDVSANNRYEVLDMYPKAHHSIARFGSVVGATAIEIEIAYDRERLWMYFVFPCVIAR